MIERVVQIAEATLRNLRNVSDSLGQVLTLYTCVIHSSI